ncbi:glycosyltransferase family 39 protein [Candidatus Kuenenia sp.]|uniref:ArnT family glycosyltransferase n=1 Tax=Candidatus Kuenenia sp. TaxID=2499824 RepID=UPI00321F85DC
MAYTEVVLNGENERYKTSGWGIVLAITGFYCLFSTLLTVGNYHLSGDSFDYLTLARNIFRGEGFSRVGQVEVYRQPGYPYLIAGFLFLFRDLELTGHVVSLFCGALSIPAVFWAAKQFLPARYALYSTVLLAVNPFFAHAGSEALSETSNALFSIIALGFLFAAYRQTTFKSVVSSVFFGLFCAVAYFCRSESLLLLPAGIIFLIVFKWKERLKCSLCVIAAVIALTVACFPYWNMLKTATGRFNLGGNSVNLIWYQSTLDKRPPKSFDPDWAPRPFDPLWPSVTHPADFNPGRYVRLNAPELIKRYVCNTITYLTPLAEILFFGFGFVLLFSGIRRGPGITKQNVFHGIWAGLFPLLTLSFRAGTDRLLIPYLPVFSILMAIGLLGISEWIQERIPFFRFKSPTLKIIIIIFILLLPMIKMTRHIGRGENWRHFRYRDVGDYIKKDLKGGQSIKIVADDSAPAFFAGGDAIAIPDTTKYKKLIEQMDAYGAQYLIVTREKSPIGGIKIPELKNPAHHDELRLLKTFPGEIDLYRRTEYHTPLSEK